MSEASISRPGHRPDISKLKDLLNDPAADLIPVRIAFLILAHKDPDSLVCYSVFFSQL